MEKKIYMKPSTEMFFVENPQLMAGTVGGGHEGSNPAEPDNPIIEQEDAKRFDLWDDEDPEALYGNPALWDE